MKNIYVATALYTLWFVPVNAINTRPFFNLFRKKQSQSLSKKLAVPAKSRITLHNLYGSYTIKPWSQQKVALEVQKKGTEEQLDHTTVTTKVVNQDVTIATQALDPQDHAYVHYTIRVPEDAALKITQLSGPVTVTGVEGDIDISLEFGSIDIVGAVKTVIAKTGRGTISVQQRKLTDLHSIFLQVHNGNISLSLPRESKGSLTASVQRGSIVSAHPVTMLITTTLDRYCWDPIKKHISGVLGTVKTPQDFEHLRGTSPITLEVTRGTIAIKEI